MVTVAAGMESDFSDSDCEMVFTPAIATESKDKLNTTESIYKDKLNTTESKNKLSYCSTVNNKTDGKLDSVQEPKNLSNGPIGNSVTKVEGKTRMTPRYIQSLKERNQSKRRQCVDVQSSQVMDDLRYAIMQGNLEATTNILSKGIWVDTILKAGWTGLMYACSAGHSDIAGFLLEKEADPNYHKDMFTPLMAVCASKKNEDDLLKCCSLLLQHGAKVNAYERHYTTPLMFAAREGHLRIVKELLDHEANPNMQESRGNTALALSTMYGHGQITRLLIERGANLNIFNNMGQSPIDLAREQGHNEVVSLLQNGHILKDAESSKNYSETPLKAATGNNQVSKLTRSKDDSKTFSKLGELELFLFGVGLQELVPVFAEHQLNFHDLLVMDEAELEKIGINQLGVRKKILDACKAVHKKEWQTSSLSNLKQSHSISCPDAVAMMANIAKHLKYIASSVIYIRQQIQSQPRILELSQDSANVHDLLDEMEDSLKNIRFLNDELRFFKMHLEKVQDKVQYIPADLTVETIPKEASQRKVLYASLGIAVTSAVVVTILWKYPDAFNHIHSSVQTRLSSLT